jgi:hypothetical protein
MDRIRRAQPLLEPLAVQEILSGRDDTPFLEVWRSLGYSAPATSFLLTTATPRLHIRGATRTQLRTTNPVLIKEERGHVLAEIPEHTLVEIRTLQDYRWQIEAINELDIAFHRPPRDTARPLQINAGPFAGDAGPGVILLTLPANETFTITTIIASLVTDANAGNRTTRLGIRPLLGAPTGNMTFASQTVSQSSSDHLVFGAGADADTVGPAITGLLTSKTRVKTMAPIVISPTAATTFLTGLIDGGVAGDLVNLSIMGTRRPFSLTPDTTTVRAATDGLIGF